VQELQQRLTNLDRLVNVDKQSLQRQVHNLQNLLMMLKVPANALEGASKCSEALDLLRDEQLDLSGADDAMSTGLESLCNQRSKVVEATEVSYAAAGPPGAVPCLPCWCQQSDNTVQAEREQHEAEVKQLEERHRRDIERVRGEYELHQASARQQLDDTGRIHDDLVAVRTELAEARIENETLYHKQLIPAQVRVLKMHLLLGLNACD
jgi:hypothetical protein